MATTTRDTSAMHAARHTQRSIPPEGRIGSSFGGAFVTRSLFCLDSTSRLLDEAYANWHEAHLQDSHLDDFADGRGGQPARRLWSGPGGPVQDAGYYDPRVHHKLSALVGRQVRPSGSRGSYSYYTDNNQYLALHRDVETCDLTTITVLADNSDARDPRGGLLFYANRCHEPLSEIRRQPRLGDQIVKAPAGSTIVIAGGEVAHQLLPVATGTTRIISVLCFEVAAD